MELRTKQCTECEIRKPIDQYYGRSGGSGSYSWCKDCHQTMTKKYSKNPNGVTSVQSQSDVITELKRNGVYACAGNGTEYPHADIVAWGCVLIEVKKSYQDKRRKSFKWGFTPKQINDRVLADLIILILDNKGDRTFHIIPADHEVFFKNDGSRKGAVDYAPGAKPKCRKGYNPALSDETMQAFQDHWGLVEAVRLRKVYEISALITKKRRLKDG